MKIGRIVVKCADGEWKQQGNTECRSKYWEIASKILQV